MIEITKKSLIKQAKNQEKETGYLVTAVKINNLLQDLQSSHKDTDKIEFVDVRSQEGALAYQRSLLFLMIATMKDLYPKLNVAIEYSINNGIYCEVTPNKEFTEESLAKLKAKMREYVDKARDIVKYTLPREDAVSLFKNSGQLAKAELINSLKKTHVTLYYSAGYYDYLYGPMLYNTKLLGNFDLDYAPKGLIVRTPLAANPNEIPAKIEQPKIAKVFDEAERWASILRCHYVAKLNEYIKNNQIDDVIRISEALHEKKIAQIADEIAENIDNTRLILIAGPSSSGKTTFAQRLRLQLLVNDIQPISISLDNYFIDREFTPRTPEGEYDFENIKALDIEMFNDNLLRLFKGEEVELPHYNFITGKREWVKDVVRIKDNQPIIVEGIHGLNPELTPRIPPNQKFKIYISAITQLNIDCHNRIPTTDARLIRRIVRDYQFRGSEALKTIKQWPDVRKGEEKYIFPYQENADVMFNSALIYELAVLKKYARPLLMKIPTNIPERALAQKLIDFLDFFEDITNEEAIQNTSILHEFIGKSCFNL